MTGSARPLTQSETNGMQLENTSSVNLSEVLLAASVPALPQTAVRVLEICQNPDHAPAELAIPIETDGALASQVLRFVNSSYFGLQHQVGSVTRGVSLLGVRTIKNFILWTAVFSAIRDPKSGVFSLECFRCDALRRGLFAKSLIRLLGKEGVEEVFTAALLQDIAVPLLARELGEPYLAVLKRRSQSRLRLSLLEQQTFGWTHADAAHMLFKRWKLPADLGEMVRVHTQSDTIVEPSVKSAGQVAVALSSLLPSDVDDGWHEFALFEKHLSDIGVCRPLHQGLLAEVDQAFDDVAASFGVVGEVEPLVDRYAGASSIIRRSLPHSNHRF